MIKYYRGQKSSKLFEGGNVMIRVDVRLVGEFGGWFTVDLLGIHTGAIKLQWNLYRYWKTYMTGTEGSGISSFGISIMVPHLEPYYEEAKSTYWDD